MNEKWPAEVPVAQVRIARPTDRLHEVVAFYRDGLGLTIIDSFRGPSSCQPSSVGVGPWRGPPEGIGRDDRPAWVTPGQVDEVLRQSTTGHLGDVHQGPREIRCVHRRQRSAETLAKTGTGRKGAEPVLP